MRHVETAAIVINLSNQIASLVAQVKLSVVTFTDSYTLILTPALINIQGDQRPEVDDKVSHSVAKVPYSTCQYATHRSVQLCFTEKESCCP